MKQLKHFIYVLLVTLAISTFSTTLNAEALIDQYSNVFKFQQKLAENGNINAQYKLAFMYETGEGVSASFDNALYWYNRAAKAGLKKAEHRNTYLIVRELGFSKKIHQSWLNSVITDANNHEPEAMLLLGQLYRQGLGVKKNLNKSLSLLTQISVLGEADVSSEIDAIHAEITAAKKVKVVKRPRSKVASKPVAAKQQKKKQVAKQAAKPSKVIVKQQTKAVAPLAVNSLATDEKQRRAEKLRRYKKVMLQLKIEQQLIDQQQADVTGGALAVVEDEF